MTIASKNINMYIFPQPNNIPTLCGVANESGAKIQLRNPHVTTKNCPMILWLINHFMHAQPMTKLLSSGKQSHINLKHLGEDNKNRELAWRCQSI